MKGPIGKIGQASACTPAQTFTGASMKGPIGKIGQVEPRVGYRPRPRLASMKGPIGKIGQAGAKVVPGGRLDASMKGPIGKIGQQPAPGRGAGSVEEPQ